MDGLTNEDVQRFARGHLWPAYRPEIIDELRAEGYIINTDREPGRPRKPKLEASYRHGEGHLIVYRNMRRQPPLGDVPVMRHVLVEYYVRGRRQHEIMQDPQACSWPRKKISSFLNGRYWPMMRADIIRQLRDEGIDIDVTRGGPR